MGSIWEKNWFFIWKPPPSRSSLFRQEVINFFLCSCHLLMPSTTWMLNAGDALSITQMIVPSHVQRGSDAVLRCLFDLNGDLLYSIKWYKGSHGIYILYSRLVGSIRSFSTKTCLLGNTEFFGYVPKETPQFRVFPWSNFSIHVSLLQVFII